MRSTYSSTGSPRSENYSNETFQLAHAWQDEADNEEWSAWAEDAGSVHAAKTEDEGVDGEFGAWVDSRDCHTLTAFHSSTPSISQEENESPRTVTIRELRRMNSLERDVGTHVPQVTHTSLAGNEDLSGLYLNPWNDQTLPKERPSYRTEDDENDVDPETDSALAFSAWESTLSSAEAVRSENEDDDDSAVYDAWDDSEHVESQDFTSADDIVYGTTTVMRDIVSHKFLRGEAEPKIERVSRQRLGEHGPVKDREGRATTWMHRLVANSGMNNNEKMR